MTDAILYWNDVSLNAVAEDHTGTVVKNPNGTDRFIKPTQEQGGPTRTSRALAIVHLAMYDAFNEIERTKGGAALSAYLPGLPTPPSTASQEAAVGAAAFVTLSELYKKQVPTFEEAYRAFLKDLNGPSPSIDKSEIYGREIAQLLLESRKNDGSDKELPYRPSDEPGFHRPDPFHPNQGFLGPNWGQVKTFGINLFLSPGPAPLNSLRYSVALNRVKSIGARNSAVRTVDETTRGLFWGYDGSQKLGTPPRLYNQIARVIAEKKANTQAQNARFFALINMAMADAGIQCWYSKYHYNFWRPVVGIREANEGWGPTGKGDGNTNTVGDPYWQPLGAPQTNPNPGETNFTPNFPAYPSGHATFGAASLDLIRLFYGENVEFEFTSEELNGKSIDVNGNVRAKHTRKLTLLQSIQENADSRIFLGIHWDFDAADGMAAGKEIADHVFNNYLK